MFSKHIGYIYLLMALPLLYSETIVLGEYGQGSSMGNSLQGFVSDGNSAIYDPTSLPFSAKYISFSVPINSSYYSYTRSEESLGSANILATWPILPKTQAAFFFSLENFTSISGPTYNNSAFSVRNLNISLAANQDLAIGEQERLQLGLGFHYQGIIESFSSDFKSETQLTEENSHRLMIQPSIALTYQDQRIATASVHFLEGELSSLEILPTAAFSLGLNIPLVYNTSSAFRFGFGLSSAIDDSNFNERINEYSFSLNGYNQMTGNVKKLAYHARYFIDATGLPWNYGIGFISDFTFLSTPISLSYDLIYRQALGAKNVLAYKHKF